eukprot:Rmarinus@m.740
MFGKKKTTKEIVRENDREINRGQRDLDRELNSLKKNEQLILKDIKKLCESGRQEAARSLAKSLVQNRKQQERMIGMKSKMTSVKARTHAMGASVTAASAMAKSAEVMEAMNRLVDRSEVQKMTKDFAKANMKMEMGEDIMDSLDDMMMDDDVDEEATSYLNAITEEIALDIGAQAGSVPTTTPGGVKHATQEDDTISDKQLNDLLAGL